MIQMIGLASNLELLSNHMEYENDSDNIPIVIAETYCQFDVKESVTRI